MARESIKAKRERAIKVADRMEEHYPNAPSALDYTDPFTLTIAVALSAQTTDVAVNKITPELFAKYGTPEKMAQADPEDLMRILRPIGFYKTKAKRCIECAQMILSDYGGKVPDTMKDLQRLPGVGRKTANIVLNLGFGKVEGMAVDTHVFRIAHKLKFSNGDTPDKVEADLMKLYPEKYWEPLNQQWVLFGRDTCIARRPKCAECFINDLCPSAFK